MMPLVLITVGFLLVFFTCQAVMTLGFLGALKNSKRDLIENDECPFATVILCLRGKDPFLKNCLDGVLTQDYPGYEVRVMIDHEDDPALPIVRDFLRERKAERLQIEVLTNRREDCSLKCSSLIEATSAVDGSCKVIALLDADTVPHSTWLRELVTALQPQDVGAATGNRWYVPVPGSIASLTRYLWNAFAVVQMHCFRIPWGGSLALKTSFLREANLPERWSRAFCEDTMLFGLLKQRGLKLALVPSVLMTNREDCDFRDLAPWIQRQLLTVRLYHPFWPGVATHGILTAALPVLVGSGLLASITAKNWGMALSVAGTAVAYGLAMGLLLVAMEFRVRNIAAERGEAVNWINSPALLKLLAAIPVLQILYPLTLAKVFRMREIGWRGVRYQIKGPWKIRRGQHLSFGSEGQKKPGASL